MKIQIWVKDLVQLPSPLPHQDLLVQISADRPPFHPLQDTVFR